MTEVATDTRDGGTLLSTLAESANAHGDWWKEDAPERTELELPTRVLTALENEGIFTVEQLKAAGPARIRKMRHVGKQAYEQIVALLRALDRQNGGAPK